MEELLRAAQQADPQALSELLKQFQPLIQACCFGLSRADAEDLQQELRMKLILLVRRYKFSERP